MEEVTENFGKSSFWKYLFPLKELIGELVIFHEISRAFTVQSRLCYRKHSSLKHHPCNRAMINLQPCIRRPRCDKSRANSTPRHPCCQQQAPLPTSTQHAPLPTSCLRLTLQQTSAQTLLQGLLPSWSILIFVRSSSHTPLARSFLWETTASPSQTTSKKFDLRNFFRETSEPHVSSWTTSKQFDLQGTSVTTFIFQVLWRFICISSLQSSPDIVCYGSVLFSVALKCWLLCAFTWSSNGS